MNFGLPLVSWDSDTAGVDDITAVWTSSALHPSQESGVQLSSTLGGSKQHLSPEQDLKAEY